MPLTQEFTQEVYVYFDHKTYKCELKSRHLTLKDVEPSNEPLEISIPDHVYESLKKRTVASWVQDDEKAGVYVTHTMRVMNERTRST